MYEKCGSLSSALKRHWFSCAQSCFAAGVRQCTCAARHSMGMNTRQCHDICGGGGANRGWPALRAREPFASYLLPAVCCEKFEMAMLKMLFDNLESCRLFLFPDLFFSSWGGGRGMSSIRGGDGARDAFLCIRLQPCRPFNRGTGWQLTWAWGRLQAGINALGKNRRRESQHNNELTSCQDAEIACNKAAANSQEERVICLHSVACHGLWPSRCVHSLRAIHSVSHSQFGKGSYPHKIVEDS